MGSNQCEKPHGELYLNESEHTDLIKLFYDLNFSNMHSFNLSQEQYKKSIRSRTSFTRTVSEGSNIAFKNKNGQVSPCPATNAIPGQTSSTFDRLKTIPLPLHCVSCRRRNTAKCLTANLGDYLEGSQLPCPQQKGRHLCVPSSRASGQKQWDGKTKQKFRHEERSFQGIHTFLRQQISMYVIWNRKHIIIIFYDYWNRKNIIPLKTVTEYFVYDFWTVTPEVGERGEKGSVLQKVADYKTKVRLLNVWVW